MASIPLAALHVNPPTPPENPLEQYARIQQLQGLAQEREMRQQQMQMGGVQLQEAQQNLAARKALNDAYASAVTKDENGKAAFDPDKLQSALATGPAAYKTPEVMEGITKFQKARVDLTNAMLDSKEKSQDLIAGAASAVKAAGYDPTLAHSLLDQLPQSPQLDSIRQQIDNPTAFKQIIDSAIAQSPTVALKNTQIEGEQAALPGKRAEAEQKVRANAATQLAGATSQQQYAQLLGELPFKVASAFPTPDKWTPDAKDQILQAGMTPHEQAQVPMEKLEYKDWAQQQQAAGKPSDRATFMKYQKTLVPQFNFNLAANGGPAVGTPVADVAKRFNLTPEAFDQQAEKYFQTGNLPPIGRGNPASLALNKALMNRANELHPGASLAGNEAAFKANQESLKKLQSNFDQVTAFENTANKNLDLFINQAKKVVDSGSPWVNKPLRVISKNLLGSDDQAAYETARQIAVNEIAKVTGSPGLSGQLSDSARHEVSEFNPNNATLAQTLRVAQTLRQDMANRHQSYADQITDIKGRIGGGSNTNGGSNSGGGSSNQPNGSQPLTLTLPSGKTITIH